MLVLEGERDTQKLWNGQHEMPESIKRGYPGPHFAGGKRLSFQHLSANGVNGFHRYKFTRN